MADLSLDEIASRIADAVIDSVFLNKKDLTEKIRPILKIWIKKADSFKSQKATKSKLQYTIEKKAFSEKFWRRKFTEVTGKDNMQPYYDELNNALKQEGFNE